MLCNREKVDKWVCKSKFSCYLFAEPIPLSMFLSSLGSLLGLMGINILNGNEI